MTRPGVAASAVALPPADPLFIPEAAALSAPLLPAKAPEPALVVGEDDSWGYWAWCCLQQSC